MNDDEQRERDTPATKKDLQLLASNMRLLILGSVALNQFLSAVALPSTLSAAIFGGGAAAIIAKPIIIALMTR